MDDELPPDSRCRLYDGDADSDRFRPFAAATVSFFEWLCFDLCASFLAHCFFSSFFVRTSSDELLESLRLLLFRRRLRRSSDELELDDELDDPLSDELELELELDRTRCLRLRRLASLAAAFLDSILNCNSSSFWISSRFFSKMSGSASSSSTVADDTATADSDELFKCSIGLVDMFTAADSVCFKFSAIDLLSDWME